MSIKCLRVAALLSLVLCLALDSSLRAQNSALSFNGVDGFVAVPASAPLNAYPLTIMCWFRTSQTNAQPALVSKYSSGSLSGYQIYITPSGHLSGWYFRDINNNVWGNLDGGFVADGLWHHAAFVVDNAGDRIYVDGVLKNSVLWTGSPGATTSDWQLYFGEYLGALTNFLNGQMDEVSLWNTNLSIAQIQSYLPKPLAGNEPGLLAYWHFNEAGGTAVSNSTAGGGFGSNYFDGAFAGGVTRFLFPLTFTQTATFISTNAVLHGTVNPNNLQASAWFVWGTTTNYGNSCAPISLPATNTIIAVSNVISGLIASTNYHYRVVASNATGLNFGADTGFTAPTFAQVSTPLPGSQYSSVAWGDYDNDGLLDVVIMGMSGFTPITQVWRNTGSGFTKTADLTGLTQGAAAWGDFDNDGRLDLLIVGEAVGSIPTAQVWRNNGSVFTNINANLVGVFNSSAVWGDFDNDGRLDFLITGITAQSIPITHSWHNNGHGGFDPAPSGLPGVFSGSLALGDYDNDGWIDVLITGIDSGGHPLTQVGHNSNGTFVNINAGLTPLSSSSAAWGDYDNDGRLDILISGDTGSGLVTQVWRNTGSGFTNINAGLSALASGSVAWGDYDNDGRPDALISGLSGLSAFTEVWGNTTNGFIKIADLPGIQNGSAVWGDYNNDGRLDILLAGSNLAQLWENHTPTTNTPPGAPSGLSATLNGFALTFTWNAATDAQTLASGLSYNLRIGTGPYSVSVASPYLSPMSATNGFRLVPRPGNRGHTFSMTLNFPPYYRISWSVQAVDSALAGSPFSAENSFTIFPAAAPFSANTLTPGDLNGDGVVDSSELNTVYAKYLLNTPGFAMTNIAGLGQSNVTFGISNSLTVAYTVQVSSNLLDWQTLGPALPQYFFTDTNAPLFSPRYYRLSYP
jgi:hypothetical protein